MPISPNIKDRELGKFCENSLGKPAVDVCLDPDQLAQIGQGSSLERANSYSSTLFGYEDYNAYLIEDDSPTEYTVYYFNYGVEIFHMTIIQDQVGNNTVQKLGPKARLDKLRFTQSTVSTADEAGKTVAILYAIGNVNTDTVFSITDASGFFTIDTINSPNTVTLVSAIPSGTYNFTVTATAGVDVINEPVTVVVP